MQNKKLVVVICVTLALMGTMLAVNPVKAGPYDIDVYTWGFVDNNTTYNSGSINNPIQSAVNYGAINYVGGYKMVVNPGTYPEHVQIDSSSDNSELTGKRAVLDGVGYTLPYGFELIGTRNVKIKGFTIRHYSEAGIYIHRDNSVMLRALGNTLWKNVIEDNSGTGIVIGASDANTVKVNTVQNNGRIGVFIDDGLKNKISSNTIYKNGWSGIEYHIAPDTEVKGNNVTGNGQYGLNADGYSTNSDIKGNTFSFNNLGGMHLLSGGNTIVGNTVDNNGIRYWQGNGILLEQGDGNVVTGNEIYLNGLDGIMVSYSWWNMDPSDGNTITFNTVNGNRHGIFIYTTDYNKVWNNIVGDNYCNGIQVVAGDYNTIYSNYVTGNGWGYPPLWPTDGIGVDLSWDGYGTNHWGTGTVDTNTPLLAPPWWLLTATPNPTWWIDWPIPPPYPSTQLPP